MENEQVNTERRSTSKESKRDVHLETLTGPVNMYDPFNWPVWLKWAIVINCFVYLFLSIFQAGISSEIPQIIAQAHYTRAEATNLFTYAILALGVGNLVWVPLAKFTGKRISVLISSTLFFVCLIWGAVATSYNSLLASRIVGGIAGSSLEAIGPAVITDLFFEHQYATVASVYGIFVSLGPSMATLLAGYIATGAGYKWFFWLCTILGGINMVTLWLFFPETTYTRNLAYNVTGEELEENVLNDKAVVDTALQEGVSTGYIDPRASSGKHWFWCNIFFIRHPHIPAVKNPLAEIFRPIVFILQPAVLIGSISYGVTLGAIVVSQTLIAVTLPYPPYNFAPGNIGLLAIPGMIGTFIGAFIGGWLTDRYSNHKKTQRKHKPEDRLVLLIAMFVVGPVGVLWFGASLAHGTSWVSIAFSLVLINMPIAGSPAIIVAYCCDSFIFFSSDVQVMIMAAKNLFAFGVSFYGVDWFLGQGILNASGQLAGIYWFTYLLFVPIYFFGPALRSKTMLWLK